MRKMLQSNHLKFRNQALPSTSFVVHRRQSFQSLSVFSRITGMRVSHYRFTVPVVRAFFFFFLILPDQVIFLAMISDERYSWTYNTYALDSWVRQ